MRWFLIGIGYIGASVALKARSHIGIEYFILNMNRTFRKIAIIVGYLAIITFLMVVLIVSWQAALDAQRQYGSILRVQMVWVKLNLPIGSLFMLIHMVYFAAGILTEKEETRDYVISGGHEV
jgi:TRAP-type C4-dicarboxylate transport system permease small subunit